MRRSLNAKKGNARIARPASACLALTLMAGGTAARSQETILIQPALPDDFDRGRNVSVTQRARPDYDPLGIPLGSFVVLPELTVATGYSNNIYYAQGGSKTGDAFIDITPGFELKSDWSRNRFDLKGRATFDRYFSNPLRNQTPWNLDALGTVEIGSNLQVIPEVLIERQFETPFSGETAATTAVLSSYVRKFASLRTEYASGQTKLTVAIDNNNYQFADIRFQSGVITDQSDRDRNILRATGQFQYAFTPSVAAYAQINYSHTTYDRPLLRTGDPNRDSNGYRAIGGLNLDLASLLRGTLGVGYVHRDFDSPFYRSIGGFAAEAKLEYFPSELTTVTLGARRIVEDAALTNTGGFFDTRASLNVDHELLRNLLLHIGGDYAHQDYIDTPIKQDVYRITGGANYFSRNWLKFSFDLGYTGRSSVTNNQLGLGFKEFRGMFGVTFRR